MRGKDSGFINGSENVEPICIDVKVSTWKIDENNSECLVEII